MIAKVIEAPTSTLLDLQNPYPGLQSFEEHDQDYFYGRDGECDELARKIRREVLTVLFGRSGLGKSSLLRAGVFPVLREERFLPITIRLDFSIDARSLVEQVRALIEEALDSEEIEAAEIRADETLWEYFHRAEIWNERNRLLTPLLVFDQFEEIFTLGENDPRVKPFLIELSDLIENRIPSTVRDRLGRIEEDLPFSYDRQNFHVIFSLREDYVAYLEDLKPLLPSIGLNHYRLNRMNGLQALEAILKPGRELVDEEVARQILYFIAGTRKTGGIDSLPKDLTELEAEPALLSLFCREINQKRLSHGLPRITAELVSGERGNIVSGFYDRSVADLSAVVQTFIEERLLTASGSRRSEPLEDALSAGVTESALASLVDRRLLRLERRLGTSQVELIHDVLSQVILERRLSRRRRESLRKKLRWVALGVTVVGILVLTVSIPWISWSLKGEAEVDRHHAEDVIKFMVFDLHDRLSSIGRLDLLAASQQKLLTYLENLPVDEKSDDSAYSRGIVRYNLGDIYLQQGKNRDALSLYRTSLKTFESLSQKLPAVQDYRFQAGVAYSHIAKALDQQGKLTASLSRLTTSFSILNSLMESQAAKSDVHHAFLRLHAELGEILLRLGRCEEGLDYLRKAVRLAQDLVRRDPENAKLRMSLADFYILLGNAERTHGEIKNAHQMFSEAERILDHPASPDLAYKRETAWLKLGLGSAFLAEGNALTALRLYEEAANLQRQVVVDSGSSAALASAAVENIRNAWAEALLQSGDLTKAESTIKAAVESGTRLTSKNAGNSDWQFSLAVSRTVEGEVQATLHRPGQAIKSYEMAIAALDNLIHKSPEEIGLMRASSWSHLLAGDAYKQMSADLKAKDEWAQALAIIEPVAQHVDDADVRDNYVRALIARGQMERAQPICRELREQGWNWKGFQDLCHTSSGTLAAAMK